MMSQGYFLVTSRPLFTPKQPASFIFPNQIQLTKHLNSAWRIHFSRLHSFNICNHYESTNSVQSQH